MARPLPSSYLLMQQKLVFLPAAVAPFIMLTVIFTIFSAVIFLCGGHQGMINSVTGKEKTKTVRLGGENKKKTMEKMKSSLSSKALLMKKMISWRKVDNVEGRDEEDVDEDGVVWKKTIIKGEKCRSLDFSGQILYDSDGKLLPD